MSNDEYIEIKLDPTNKFILGVIAFIILQTSIIVGFVLISQQLEKKTLSGTEATTTATTANTEATASALMSFAESSGWDTKKIQSCIDDGTGEAIVKSNIEKAAAAGVQGTPSFIIGKVNDKNITGYFFSGALPIEYFDIMYKKVKGESLSESETSTYNTGLSQGYYTEKQVTADISNAVVMGNSAYMIVEFSDYECPYCQRHALETGPSLKTKYLDTGIMSWGFVDFPLSFHDPIATQEAEFAQCVYKATGSSDEYFKVHDYIFSNTGSNGVGVQ